MNIKYLNFKPNEKDKYILSHEFDELKEHFCNETHFKVKVEKAGDIYKAHATIESPYLNIESDMTGRSLEIIGPSLSMELKVKSALLLNEINIQKAAMSA